MSITPITGASSLNRQSNVAFTGKNQTKETHNNQSSNIGQKTIIPATMFLISLSPSLLNATVAKQDVNINPQHEITQNNVTVSKDLPYYLQDENLRYAEEFEMDGKDYFIYYSDSKQHETEDDNRILDIYIAPEDFELVTKNGEEMNSPMRVTELVYHRNDNFVGAVVRERMCDKNGENEKLVTKEIKLPDDIGYDLLDTYFGQNGYYIAPNRIKCSGTDSSELRAEKEVEPEIRLVD